MSDVADDGQTDEPDPVVSTIHAHGEFKAWMKERQVIAWERIADALEKIAGNGGTDGSM